MRATLHLRRFQAREGAATFRFMMARIEHLRAYLRRLSLNWSGGGAGQRETQEVYECLLVMPESDLHDIGLTREYVQFSAAMGRPLDEFWALVR
jgi:hypothetical protein